MEGCVFHSRASKYSTCHLILALLEVPWVSPFCWKGLLLHPFLTVGQVEMTNLYLRFGFSKGFTVGIDSVL